MEESKSAFKILTGKPTGKRPLGRPRHRWEDIIRMNLEERGIKTWNWVDSVQDRDYWRTLMNVALNLQPYDMELVILILPSHLHLGLPKGVIPVGLIDRYTAS